MVETEVSLGAEIGFGVLGVLAVLPVQFVNEALVGCLREPTLLIQQSQDTHRLHRNNKL